MISLKCLYYKILKFLDFETDEVLYISGTEKLPPVLTSEEENKLLLKLVNKDRFETFLSLISLSVLIIIAVNNPVQSPIERWHDAIEDGMSWSEYTKEMR